MTDIIFLKKFRAYFGSAILLVLSLLVIACSKEDHASELNTKGSISFKLSVENNLSKQARSKVPPCSEALPSYADIVISGNESIGTLENPFRINFTDAGVETEALQLSIGTFQLEYFAVFDASGTMIWIAPTQEENTEYTDITLPLTFEISQYDAQTINVDVVCLEDRALNNPDALTAAAYVSDLGAGFDVTWSEFNRYMELYDEQVALDFANAGFKNVRIRMGDPNPDATFISNLRQQINDAINYGINPIIAYQGHYLEETATSDEDARNHLVNWWRNMAEQLQDMPAELAFNIMVEISGTYKTDYTAMNSFYADVYDAIRETNPDRIIIFPPVNISNPDYLQYLEIPGGNDPFVMAEWHFYAAGPSTDSSNKKYWADGSTALERNNITEPIETAVNWMNSTGHVSWVGAWMAGNYNKGNDYSVEQQVGIASFITRTLNGYNIPFSVNAGNKFYDYETLSWFNRTDDAAGIPVRDAIIDSEKAAVYSAVDYLGTSSRLSEGSYSASQLQSLGFYENISSIMVPFDYEVIVYDADNFSGNSQTLDITDRDLSGFQVRSIQVNFKNSY